MSNDILSFDILSFKEKDYNTKIALVMTGQNKPLQRKGLMIGGHNPF